MDNRMVDVLSDKPEHLKSALSIIWGEGCLLINGNMLVMSLVLLLVCKVPGLCLVNRGCYVI